MSIQIHFSQSLFRERKTSLAILLLIPGTKDSSSTVASLIF